MNALANTSVLLSNYPTGAELVELARHVENCGFSRVWLAETGGLEVGALGGVIANTTSLEVGTAIVPVYSRSPALLAMMASTWAQLGDDRPIHLGIGAGGQVIVERWHGVPFDKPATTTRETIEILRQALSAQRTDFTGRTRRSTGFRLLTGPAPSVRIYVGGMGPAMVDLAAELSDGLIVTWLSPRVLEKFAEDFGNSVERHGRNREAVRLVARAYVAVTDTVDLVREEVRKELVEYLVSPPYAKYFSSVGFDVEVEQVNAAFSSRDRQRAVAAVSDRLLDEILIVGSDAADIEDRIRAYHAAGAQDVMIQPVTAARGGNPRRTIETVARALA